MTASSRISRADLEAKFASLQGGATDKVADARQKLITAAAVGGVVLVVLAYFLGRRKGKRLTTVVEIRRV